MDNRALRAEIEQDLRLAATTGKVLYLEGRTDVPMLIGLLGRPTPPVIPDEGWALDGIWLRGLDARSRGSGGTAVQQRVQVADECGFRGVRGIIDGDGLGHDELARSFDAPFSGPLHHWKAYCLENLLAQASWPPAWGPPPNWPEVLASYIPYAALNRVVRSIHAHSESLGIARFSRPIIDQAPKTATEIQTQLAQGLATRPQQDVEAEFRAELQACEIALRTSLAHAHALVNGKWLVEVYGAQQARKAPEICRREWADHVGTSGGHPDVIAWWERFRGLP